MTKIKQMIDAGIPVIDSQSNEEAGVFAFSAMTQEQQDRLNIILGGWNVIRPKRNERIETIRWMLDEGMPITLAKRMEVLDYIQMLRDIPQLYADPLDVVWPQEPKYEAD